MMLMNIESILESEANSPVPSSASESDVTSFSSEADEFSSDENAENRDGANDTRKTRSPIGKVKIDDEAIIEVELYPDLPKNSAESSDIDRENLKRALQASLKAQFNCEDDEECTEKCDNPCTNELHHDSKFLKEIIGNAL